MIEEENIVSETIFEVAKKMLIAARTAPKAKGIDNLAVAIADSEDIKKISEKMKEIGKQPNTPPAFSRDAENILNCHYMVLLGTNINSLGLPYCGLCGFPNCSEKEKHPDIPCSFNTGDLGIAIGSAVSIAMDARVDNRIMYTVGMAVKQLSLMSEDVKIIYGIPLSATSKNIFFDRK